MHLGIPIENLKDDPYASVICYPRAESTELNDRLSELRMHGITSVDFTGKNNAFGLPILGKGFVGIVFKANIDGKTVALKIRRIDSSRKDLQHEAKMLLFANSVEVGPKFQSVSKNCLLMDLIDGNLLPFWLKSFPEKRAVKKVFRDLISQCRRLDKKGLDHGELSKAPKHIIINKKMKPFIVDFETASISRTVSNVTSICQFLFLNYGSVGKIAVKILGNIDRNKIIKALKKYKTKKTNDNFTLILQACLY
jgi:putative serine/threonine protein kinase